MNSIAKTLVMASLFLTVNAFAKATTFKVDTAASKVTWLGKKVSGQHDGTINVKSGEVTFDGAKLTGGTIVIDMTSIKNVDIKDATYHKKFQDHMMSDDFFATAKHTEATLKVKSAKDSGKGMMEISGDLTIKGITNPVTFTAEVKSEKTKASAKGTITVDRTKYDIKYGSGKFFQNLGDKMINDTFDLTFEVQAK